MGKTERITAAVKSYILKQMKRSNRHTEQMMNASFLYADMVYNMRKASVVVDVLNQYNTCYNDNVKVVLKSLKEVLE